MQSGPEVQRELQELLGSGSRSSRRGASDTQKGEKKFLFIPFLLLLAPNNPRVAAIGWQVPMIVSGVNVVSPPEGL